MTSSWSLILQLVSLKSVLTLFSLLCQSVLSGYRRFRVFEILKIRAKYNAMY